MCHPPRTQNLSSIAILGQDRLPHAGAGEKTVKDLIYNLGNAFKNISAVDPFMVKSSGRGDRETDAQLAENLGCKSLILCIHGLR